MNESRELIYNEAETNFNSVSLSVTPTVDRRTWSFTATNFNSQKQHL